MSTLPEHLKFDSSLTVADLARRFDVTLFAGEGDLVLTHVSTPYAATAGALQQFMMTGWLNNCPLTALLLA